MNYFTDQNNLNVGSINPQKPDLNKDEKKIGIMDVFVTSIAKVSKLAEMCISNTSRFILYVVYIAILVGFTSFLVPTASKIVSFGGFHNLFNNVMPQFSVDDGILTADKKFEFKMSTSTILIDTTIPEFTADDFEYSGIFIAFGQKKLKMISFMNVDDKSTYSEIYSFNIGDVLMNGFSNKTLSNMTIVFYIVLIIMFIFTSIFAALRYLLFAAILCIFTRTSTALCKLPMTLRHTFHLNFYAQTISIILVNINEAAGYFVGPIISSVIGVVITIFVINRALAPHMPDIDEMMNMK